MVQRRLQTQTSRVAARVPTQHSISHNPTTDSIGNKFSNMMDHLASRA